MIGHIYIFGDILNYQGDGAESYGYVSLKSVTDQIQANKDADELEVHIHSPGGEVMEGFAIHDALVGSGKKITTSIEGLCASIATVIALAGSVRKITKNSEFMIHNPWGFTGGDAEELQKYTDQVKAYEEKILDFYVEKTGADKDTIKAMMDDETYLNSDKALELKFVTEIVETVMASAKIKINKSSQKDTTMFEKILSSIKELGDGLKEAIKNSGVKANLNLSTTDGKSLEIVTDKSDPEAGNVVNVDGKAAPDGEYNMPDGKTIVVAAGKISEIKAAEEEPTDKGELETIKAENAKLKADLEAANAANAKAKEDAEAITKQVEQIKNLTSQYTVKGAKIVLNDKGPGAPAEKTIEDYKKEAAEREASYNKK